MISKKEETTKYFYTKRHNGRHLRPTRHEKVIFSPNGSVKLITRVSSAIPRVYYISSDSNSQIRRGFE